MPGFSYTDANCLDALRAAAEQLGRSPTRREYESMSIQPSARVISKRFGSWNEAKREAGLPLCRGGNPPKPVEEDYFERIDTPTKAYWLGFLFGDGSLVEREYGHRVQLTQRNEDADHLLKFKRTIRSENAIIADGDVRHLRVGNPTFVSHLREQGFTTTKSTDGKLPDLPSWSLRRGFIRGLSDADGHYGPDKWTITDNTTKRLHRLQSWIPFDSDIVEERRDTRSWAYLRVTGSRTLPALYHWLFPRGHQTEPAMMRKRDSALQLLEGLF